MKYRLFLKELQGKRVVEFSYICNSLSKCEDYINRHFPSLIEIELRENKTNELLAFYFTLTRKSTNYLKYQIYLNSNLRYKIQKQN